MKTTYDDSGDDERERELIEWLTLSPDEARADARRVLRFVWGGVAAGALIPLVAACLRFGVPVLWRDTLFVLLAVISNAVPFAVYAAFALAHLARAPVHGRLIVRRRWRGAWSGAALLALMSVLSYTGFAPLKASLGPGLWYWFLIVAAAAYLVGAWLWEMLDQTGHELFLPQKLRRR